MMKLFNFNFKKRKKYKLDEEFRAYQILKDWFEEFNTTYSRTFATFEITKKGGFPRRTITYKTIQNTEGKTLAEIKDYSIEEGGLSISINKSISDIHCYEDFFVVGTVAVGNRYSKCAALGGDSR